MQSVNKSYRNRYGKNYQLCLLLLRARRCLWLIAATSRVPTKTITVLKLNISAHFNIMLSNPHHISNDIFMYFQEFRNWCILNFVSRLLVQLFLIGLEVKLTMHVNYTGNGDLKLDECSQKYTDMLLDRETAAPKQPSTSQDSTNNGKSLYIMKSDIQPLIVQGFLRVVVSCITCCIQF